MSGLIIKLSFLVIFFGMMLPSSGMNDYLRLICELQYGFEPRLQYPARTVLVDPRFLLGYFQSLFPLKGIIGRSLLRHASYFSSYAPGSASSTKCPTHQLTTYPFPSR